MLEVFKWYVGCDVFLVGKGGSFLFWWWVVVGK